MLSNLDLGITLTVLFAVGMMLLVVLMFGFTTG